MAGDQPGVAALGAVRQRLDDGTREPQPAGTLTKWDNPSDPTNPHWAFTGNGQTTSTAFIQTVVEREAEQGNHVFDPVRNSQIFAQAAASALLQTATPDNPIPNNEAKEISLKDLVGFVTPFLRAYERQQREANTHGAPSGPTRRTGDASEDERARVATGQVTSQGLQLPLD